MFWSINMEVGRLLADDSISDALHSGGSEMTMGIAKRCLDYDKDYKLKRLGFNKNQRAVGAIYIFSKEVKSIEYERLEKAVRNYATHVGAISVFAEIDGHMIWKDGYLYWNH